MAQDPNRVIAGCRLDLYVNDVLVGRGTSASFSRQYQLATVQEFGDVDDVEHEIVGRTVTMTMAKTVLDRKSLEELGIVPAGDTAEVVDFPPMAAKFVDKILGRVVLRVEGLKPESESWDVTARTLMQTNASFRGTKIFLGARA